LAGIFMEIGLAALAICVLLVGLHPFVTYPATLCLIARLAPRPVSAWKEVPESATVAVCVCAYNEQSVIRERIENLLAMRASFPRLELLVYVDAATDQTAEILRSYDHQVRVFVSPERRGKTYGMNLLVAATRADFVIFSDANVMFAPDALRHLLRHFGDPEVGCVCGHLIYTSPHDSGVAAVGTGYWRLEEFIKEFESRTGSTMGADGSIFAVRRVLHEPPPPDIIDDMFVSLSILCRGYRVVRAADALAYEQVASHRSDEFRRKVRISCQAFNVHRLLTGELRTMSALNRYKYISHKLLRWLTGYFLATSNLLLAVALGIAGKWFIVLAVLGTGGVTALFGAAFPHGRAARLLSIAEAFVGTSVGVFRSICGDRFQTWNPPASARSRET
jgi:cellulose synthase/poly-beta-1,6-N-acetylglucosamine synthase-like glycosyltransferase